MQVRSERLFVPFDTNIDIPLDSTGVTGFESVHLTLSESASPSVATGSFIISSACYLLYVDGVQAGQVMTELECALYPSGTS